MAWLYFLYPTLIGTKKVKGRTWQAKVQRKNTIKQYSVEAYYGIDLRGRDKRYLTTKKSSITIIC